MLKLEISGIVGGEVRVGIEFFVFSVFFFAHFKGVRHRIKRACAGGLFAPLPLTF